MCTKTMFTKEGGECALAREATVYESDVVFGERES